MSTHRLYPIDLKSPKCKKNENQYIGIKFSIVDRNTTEARKHLWTCLNGDLKLFCSFHYYQLNAVDKKAPNDKNGAPNQWCDCTAGFTQNS